MRNMLLGLGALLAATAAQATEIDFNSPSGLRGTSQNYSNGGYTVTAYGYTNFNFGSNSGTAGNLYDKNAGGLENGVGLQRDPSGQNEIWYARDNFATIPAVVLDVSSLLGSTSLGQFLMGSTTSNEQWILRGYNGSTWSSVLLTGMTQGSWTNLPSWGTYTQYAFYSGGTVGDEGRTTGNVLLSALRFTPSVPEPGTWAMMLLGFGAIGLATRRQRRVSASVARA